jgi:hypothetical protein
VREPRKFDIFPVAGALFVSGLPGERTQFLLGVMPLLLNPLQLCFKVLLRFSSHGPIPFSRWQVLHDSARTLPHASFSHSQHNMRACARGSTCAICWAFPACGNDTVVMCPEIARNFALVGEGCGSILCSCG